MARGARHARSNRPANGRAAQRSASHGTTSTGGDSQRTTSAAPRQAGTPKKRGRKLGSQTKLKLPQQGAKVALKPEGDMQFSYVNYKPSYKYTTQLGAILKREYPDLVEDRDENGELIRKRLALEWGDYFLNTEMTVTSGERTLSEFWRLSEVEDDLQEEADRVLEKYLQKRVRDMMYQARVDAVKLYHRKRGQEIDDTLARPIELEYEQYMDGQLQWCNDDVWPELCTYWCSKDFKVKRRRGQVARSSSEDIAQNHGGS
ncbi:hypothetical protein HU200_066272 [Digitaria exilis]|uniref:Uncharacterized protein n=1 Tax=Digitaria exilis TaxID=1010633 RepID=A0A835DWR8_9POAL|nr:hypothetical protein HU200_066272 [Digitaria exilis]